MAGIQLFHIIGRHWLGPSACIISRTLVLGSRFGLNVCFQVHSAVVEMVWLPGHDYGVDRWWVMDGVGLMQRYQDGSINSKNGGQMGFGMIVDVRHNKLVGDRVG
ncbi:hypothetical protein TNCT_445051 [Trichonephila clavata]|uniref:Uncharacterized protein n=1 Tax=Trichonephila clavata TaxID=2740835 RepID=A0A8X6IS30_TRICU|nr:hypothetical protein TNCT_445051 [Trichonephila clavata]